MAPNATTAPTTTGFRSRRCAPSIEAVTAAKIRIASRPSRKTITALLTTTTACDCGVVASVGSGDPLCATTAMPAITATIVNAASNQTPQVVQNLAVRRFAEADIRGTLPHVVRLALQPLKGE